MPINIKTGLQLVDSEHLKRMSLYTDEQIGLRQRTSIEKNSKRIYNWCRTAKETEACGLKEMTRSGG